jgi:hypothetical protein
MMAEIKPRCPGCKVFEAHKAVYGDRCCDLCKEEYEVFWEE